MLFTPDISLNSIKDIGLRSRLYEYANVIFNFKESPIPDELFHDKALTPVLVRNTP